MAETDAQRLLGIIRAAKTGATGLWPPGAVAAINAIDDPAAYRALGVLLANEPEPVRITAAVLLGDAGNPEALEALEPLLRDPSSIVRLRAAGAVAEYGADEEMVPALTQLIQGDPSALARRFAVQALFIIRDRPEASAALEMASRDSDAAVRDAARRIISAGGPAGD